MFLAICELPVSPLKSQTHPHYLLLWPKWHINLNCPMSFWVTFHGPPNVHSYIKLWAFSPVNLSLFIWLLAQLKELRRWEENYIFFSPQRTHTASANPASRPPPGFSGFCVCVWHPSTAWATLQSGFLSNPNPTTLLTSLGHFQVSCWPLGSSIHL